MYSDATDARTTQEVGGDSDVETGVGEVPQPAETLVDWSHFRHQLHVHHH